MTEPRLMRPVQRVATGSLSRPSSRRRDAKTMGRRIAGRDSQWQSPFLNVHFLGATALLAVLMSVMASDWIAGLAVLVLWAVWCLLTVPNEPYVLPAALSFHWMQITCGIFYFAITGIELETMYTSDYRPMVLLGLGCVAALAMGLVVGRTVVFRESSPKSRSPSFPWNMLFVGYVGATVLNAIVVGFAWAIPALTQGILAITFVRLAVLYLMLRRLVRPRIRLGWLLGILGFELGMGFSGYFAGFREPLVLAVLALAEAFDWRSVKHWLRMAILTSVTLVFGVLWIGIRTTYRAEVDQQFLPTRVDRLARVGQLSSEWLESDLSEFRENMDQLVDRIWAVYYPALAVARVPDVLPHENGAILRSALLHLVTPRVLFPEKPVLESDSEFVRKYSGVYVAGPEQNSSIAFGYAAESYIDFGVPLMFLPSFLFGVFMGAAYNLIPRFISHPELAMGLKCVVFWIGLFLFERSWVKTLGTSVTMLVYMGGLLYVVDRLFVTRWQQQLRR